MKNCGENGIKEGARPFLSPRGLSVLRRERRNLSLKRKLLSILTALALVLSLLPATALAEGDPDGTETNPWQCGKGEDDNVTATLVDGTLTISGSGAMADYLFYGPWESNSNIKSVVIKEGVTSIGNSAFETLMNVTSIEIPASVTSIGQRAFTSCRKLESINLPAGLTSIKTQTFMSCRALTSIEIPASVKTIGEAAFGASGLTEVRIPSGVTSIGDRAFNNCASLNTVDIPGGVESIGENAFGGTTKAEIHYEGTTEEWNNIGGGSSGAQTENIHTSDSDVTYQVTIQDGGTGATGAGTYGEGDTVNVSAGTKEGYVFTEWTAVGVTLADDTQAETTFTMPANDVTLTANWAEAVAEVTVGDTTTGYKTFQEA